jgi:NADH dehydrogenase FAD-containing subunit
MWSSSFMTKQNKDEDLKNSLITFVVVGGGFSGVETVGELNNFVRESIKHYYHNLADKIKQSSVDSH